MSEMAWPATDTPLMVVTVARAILKSRFYDPEPKAYDNMDDFWRSIYRNDHWMEAEWEARAAIEAMMEPPDEILLVRLGGSLKLKRAIWQAMLRNALVNRKE